VGNLVNKTFLLSLIIFSKVYGFAVIYELSEKDKVFDVVGVSEKESKIFLNQDEYTAIVQFDADLLNENKVKAKLKIYYTSSKDKHQKRKEIVIDDKFELERSKDKKFYTFDLNKIMQKKFPESYFKIYNVENFFFINNKKGYRLVNEVKQLMYPGLIKKAIYFHPLDKNIKCSFFKYDNTMGLVVSEKVKVYEKRSIKSKVIKEVDVKSPLITEVEAPQVFDFKHCKNGKKVQIIEEDKLLVLRHNFDDFENHLFGYVDWGKVKGYVLLKNMYLGYEGKLSYLKGGFEEIKKSLKGEYENSKKQYIINIDNIMMKNLSTLEGYGGIQRIKEVNKEIIKNLFEDYESEVYYGKGYHYDHEYNYLVNKYFDNVHFIPDRILELKDDLNGQTITEILNSTIDSSPKVDFSGIKFNK
jgi:hypothetical protein